VKLALPAAAPVLATDAVLAAGEMLSASFPAHDRIAVLAVAVALRHFKFSTIGRTNSHDPTSGAHAREASGFFA
jgi:hypothetical protein